MNHLGSSAVTACLVIAAGSAGPSVGAAAAEAAADLRQELDAPVLFTKRHSYSGIHIYDTYYKWPPGGGGIYVLENPRDPRERWRVRPVVDPSTPGSPGLGVYTDPELSWDATRLLFCFKGEPEGSTSIYEIGIDGSGLRRLTDPTPQCEDYHGRLGGQHDVSPAYLPDGRIVFLSTRPSGLVPCNNTGVAILHVMNPDGTGIRPISVNNVNDFDPAVLPDGRLLFGRWEYVDKNALTIQSLWTMHPDGTEETAFFANNMVFPEAILDARPVPGSHLIIGTFAKHNSTPRGSLALVDPRLGKNEPRAIVNLEHPDNPTFDLGDSCEPWPVTEDVFLFSGRPGGQSRNVLEIMNRGGKRAVLLADPEICLHAPMLVKPRPVPPVLPSGTDPAAITGRFYVQDIYQGLAEVKRGEVKWLRVLEETSRVSGTHPGGNPYNQTFLLSAALAFSVKHYLGLVPVTPDGSAYFEVPSGRALFLQALDAEGRLVQSMRTFVQAAPGVTRSCIGCHEHKADTAANDRRRIDVVNQKPVRPRPESWGTGFMDYPGMVQPILDRHCVSCHGGDEGIAAGMDLSGGWTEHFNISYENLVNRRETQLIAHWIAGIDCMNGTAFWSSQIFPPRHHGSGAAPLAELLVSGHQGRLETLTRAERDLLMAWIDSNGLYHGTWNYTEHGCSLKTWPDTQRALVAEMQSAGCAQCHGANGRITRFESDWFNLQHPERSRILRAPLAPEAPGLGLGLCRDRPADGQPRLRLLVSGYAHAVQPVDRFAHRNYAAPSTNGAPVVTFASTNNPHYQNLLAIIREGREQALAVPRVDLPGAETIAGVSRQFVPPPLPDPLPELAATLGADGEVRLSWEQSARTIGLEAELHRSEHAGFVPEAATRLCATPLFHHTDAAAAPGLNHYALVLISGSQRSQPVFARVTVPAPEPPPAPTGLKATAASSSIRLDWEGPADRRVGYHIYRRAPGASALDRLTERPVRLRSYVDPAPEPEVTYSYFVSAVSRRGLESGRSTPVDARAVFVREPVFVAALGDGVEGRLLDGGRVAGQLHGAAQGAAGRLDLRQGGYVTFPHRNEFGLTQPLSVECHVYFEQPGTMPVLVSCGVWQQAGWFLQRLGGHWRWHVGGIDCDGGTPAVGRWIHLTGTFDGTTARLFQDGVQVAEARGQARTQPWGGPLHLGQYSGQPAAEYQLSGQLAGVRIYHRPLAPAEIARNAGLPPAR